MEETKKESKGAQEITFNLNTLGVPIALILSAVIIALAVYFTNKSNNNNASTSATSGDNTTEESSGDSNDSDKNSNSESTTNSNSDSGNISLSIDDDPYLGTLENGKVAIVEFSDPLCYYCNKYESETFDKIKTNFVDTGKVIYVYKEYPLGAEGSLRYTIAEAGMCVYHLTNDANTFSTYHKSAFSIEDESGITTLVSSLGVDMTAYNDCMTNHTYSEEISGDQTQGSNAGVSGTPAFILGTVDANGNISGTLVSGAQAYSTFESKLNTLLGE